MPKRNRLATFAAWSMTLALVSSRSLAAEPIALEPDNVCAPVAGVQQVRPRLLLRQLYTDRVVSDRARDLNNDGDITNEERINLVFETGRWPDSTQVSASDEEALDSIIETLIGLFRLDRNSPDPLRRFKFVNFRDFNELEVPQLHELRRHLVGYFTKDVPGWDVKVQAALRAYLFLSERPGSGEIVCAEPDTTQSPSNGGVPKETTSSQRFLLRGAIEDLTKPDIKKATSATVSLASNIEDQSESLAANLVFGYDLRRWQDDAETGSLGATYLGILPFAAWKVAQSSSGKGDVNNVTIGADLHSRIFRFTKHSIWTDIIPRYTSTANSDTQIASLDIEVIPPVVLGGNNINGDPIYIGDVALIPRGRLIAQGGTALEVASDSTLKEDEVFARAGVRLAVHLVPQFGSGFEDWSLTTSAEYLNGLAGEPGDTHYWKTRLSYAISKAPFIDLGLSYVQGQEPDTFEDVESLKLDLGWKF